MTSIVKSNLDMIMIFTSIKKLHFYINVSKHYNSNKISKLLNFEISNNMHMDFAFANQIYSLT